jgi:hypothetical protein
MRRAARPTGSASALRRARDTGEQSPFGRREGGQPVEAHAQLRPHQPPFTAESGAEKHELAL